MFVPINLWTPTAEILGLIEGAPFVSGVWRLVTSAAASEKKSTEDEGRRSNAADVHETPVYKGRNAFLPRLAESLR